MPDRDGTICRTPEGTTMLGFRYWREAKPGKKGKKRKKGKEGKWLTALIRGWEALSSELVERAASAEDPLAAVHDTPVKGELTGHETATTLREGSVYSAPDSEHVAALNQRCPLVVAAPARPADRGARDPQRVRAEAEAGRKRLATERQAQIDRDAAAERDRNKHAARDFHNPYAFVPAPPRMRLNGGLGDAEPLGHDRYHPDAWSGRLAVSLRVVTPLLIPDHAVYGKTADATTEHGFYDVRTTPAGDPDLAPSALKGMLRSAFEAVTNSRLGVFSHTEPLTRRRVVFPPEKREPEPTPVRVTISKSGELLIEEMERVRLPYYGPGALCYPGGERPQTGDAVTFKWSVRPDGVAGPKVEEIELLRRAPRQSKSEGWVLVTGRAPRGTNKKHEAVFTPAGRTLKGAAERELAEAWRAVIDSYVHARAQPGSIETSGDHTRSSYRCLRRLARQESGLLCYAHEVDDTVRWLLPTRVTRIPFGRTPLKALPESLRPALSRSHLSPADRVFGWVADGASAAGGAHRGQITVKAPRCTAEPDGGAIRSFCHAPVPLAILSSPKPQQALFYAARDEHGTAPPDGEGKALRALALSESHGLRGRKVYPHQPGSKNGFAAEQPAGEFRRAADRRDDQNRSVLGWVNPGTEFTFDIDVMNLNRAELGALIWLLRRPDGHAFAFGGGRPLGFGAVRVELAGARVQTGAKTADAMRELTPQAAPTQAPASLEENEEELKLLEKDFLAAARHLCGQTDTKPPPFIAAFDRALAGLSGNLPTHYPRRQREAEVEGKNYEWFTANADGGEFVLPDILDETQGLPRNPG